MGLITISVSREDEDFFRKRGLSASQVFRDSIDRIRKQVNEGIDLSEVAIASKFARYQELIQKMMNFLEDRRLYNVFLEEQRKGRDEFDGVPEPKDKN